MIHANHPIANFSLAESLEAAGASLPPHQNHIERLGLLACAELDERGHYAYNNVVLRHFPGEHHRYSHAWAENPTIAEGQQLMAGAQAHFKILRGLHIEVPTVIYGHEHPDAARSRIVSVAEGVQGRDIAGSAITSVGTSLLPCIETDQDHILQLADSLAEYYGWVLANMPELYLSDISALVQYKITPAGRVALVDTDPIMTDPRDRAGKHRLYNNLTTVLSWLERVKAQDTAQVHRINELWAKVDVLKKRSLQK